MSAVIEVKNLSKVYRTPMRRKKVEAVKDLSFSVGRGEIFGFLGPNGAGKTTTIRVLMGLISPTRGEARIFGEKVPSRLARARIGFVPEAPYFYDYLNVAELLDLAGRLCGVARSVRRERSAELIDLVGLGHARGTPLKKYSKGMLQRAGIAQALINDPELVVFDEPMSGLDPVGRKEVRDIIHSLGEQGKTVFFSSHILADVEMICDHVAFIFNGTLQEKGALSDLMRPDLGTEVALRLPAECEESAIDKLCERAEKHRRGGRELALILSAEVGIDDFLSDVRELGAAVISVTPRHQTLEELFIQRTAESKARTDDGELEAAQ
jgi:ABC-2 type transport system ATP-binding protein